MAIAYCVLSSGSTGNCIWVSGGGIEILVDCGLSARRTGELLSKVGSDLSKIEAVVCTHGHGDHIRGAEVLARRYDVDIHGTDQTLAAIAGRSPRDRLHTIRRGERFAIRGLRFTSVPTMHDAPGSSAFVITDGETSLGIVTDLGLVTAGLIQAFSGLDGLVVEMNHDEEMLSSGPYPAFLKRRIAGSLGHLSNRQGADLLHRLAHRNLQHVMLAHLSEENNRPNRAIEMAEQAIKASPARPGLAVAAPLCPSEVVMLEKRGQLALGPW